jgi:hypothetical protein
MENFIKELNDRGEPVAHLHMNDEFVLVVTGEPHIVNVDIPAWPEYPVPQEINLEQLLWTNQMKELWLSMSSSLKRWWLALIPWS